MDRVTAEGAAQKKHVSIIITHRRVVLVDMDGVLADLRRYAHGVLQERHPNFIAKNPEDQQKPWLTQEYPHFADAIRALFREKGFFLNLPPVEGALEAMRELIARHDVFLCTQPVDSPYCEEEKALWKDTHLGRGVPIYFAADKTYHSGHCIIDDNPELTGDLLHMNPWEHVIYHRAYNQHIQNKRRIDWNNYQTVLHELF